MKKNNFKKLILIAASITMMTSLFACSNNETTSESIESNRDETKGNETSSVAEIGAGYKILSQLASNKTFDIDGKLSAQIDSHTFIIDNIDATIYAKTLENIEGVGDLEFNIDGEKLDSTITYFNDVCTIDILSNYFKASVSTIEDMIDLISSSLKVGALAPNELQIPYKGKSNIQDFLSLLNDLNNETKSLNDSNEYYYPLVVEDIEIEVLVSEDTSDTFKGIRIDNQTINDANISGVLYIDLLGNKNPNLINPLLKEDADKYLEISDAYSLVNGLLRINNQKRISADISGSVKKGGTVTSISASTSYEFNDNKLSIDADISQNEKTSHVFGAYLNEKVYASIMNMDICFNAKSFVELINYFKNKTNDSTDTFLDVTSKVVEQSQLAKIIEMIKSGVGEIKLDSNYCEIGINGSTIDDRLDDFKLKLVFNEDGIQTISVDELTYNELLISDLKIELKDYYFPEFELSSYVDIEPTFGLAKTIEKLVKQDKFNFLLNGKISKNSVNYLVQSDFNLNLAEKLIFGSASMTEPSEKSHQLDFNMNLNDELIFSYNEKLNGYFQFSTINDVKDEIEQISENNETVDVGKTLIETIEGVVSSSIFDIFDSDIISLLNISFIQNLSISSNTISLDLDVSQFIDIGFDKAHLDILYGSQNGESTVERISISDVQIDSYNIELDLQVKEYSKAIEENKLVKDSSYLDFNSIKTLLSLGINSTKLEYFYLEGTISVTFDIDIAQKTIDLPFEIDVYIKNGHVDIALEITSIPTYPFLNRNSDSNKSGWPGECCTGRRCSIYYNSENVYISRKDQFLYGRTKWYYKRCDMDYFMNNYDYVFFYDVLYLNGDIMKSMGVQEDLSYLNESESHGEHQVGSLFDFRLEEALVNYSYAKIDETEHEYFNFEINMAEIIDNEDFDNLHVNISASTATHLFNTVSGQMNINLDFQIRTKAEIEMKKFSFDFASEYDNKGILITNSNHPFYDFNAFIISHANDSLNVTTTSY